MEDINPTLEMISFLKNGLKCGRSVRSILRDTFEVVDLRAKRSAFYFDLHIFFLRFQMKSVELNDIQLRSEYRRALFELIGRGLGGESIWEPLVALEQEVKEAVETELEEHIARLPVIMLLPMIFFVMPSLLLLFLGPIIIEILAGLQSSH